MKSLLLLLLLFTTTFITAQGTWTTYPNIIPSTFPREVHFITEDLGYVACNDYKIFKTTDGGMNWVDVSPPFQPSWPGLSYTGIASLGPDTLFAPCESDDFIARTNDGGITWDSIPFQTQGSVHAVTFVNDSVGFTHGGYVHKTMDRGATWNLISTELISNPIVQITDSIFLTSGGYGGGVFKTVDQGHTWIEILTGSTDPIWGLYFFDEMNGIICGDNGRMSITSDQGINWTTQSINQYQLRDVHFVNDTLGFSCSGNNGTQFYQSNDAGQTWFGVGSYTCSGLIDIDFPTKCVGYIIGLNGYLLKYEDPICASIGTEENSYLDFSLYPNPASSSINLELPSNQIYQATLFDIQGNLIGTWNVRDSDIIDIDLLTNGVYIIAIESGGSITQNKFIKQ